MVVRKVNIPGVGGSPSLRLGLLSHVKVIHGDVHSFFHDSAVPVRAVLASLRNQQSIAFVNVSLELDGSMFTDRQKLHRHKLVTSDASEEYSFFRVIRPIN